MNRKELNNFKQTIYQTLLNESPLPPEVQDQDWEQHPEWFPGAEHETSPVDPSAPANIPPDPWFEYWWWWYHHWYSLAPNRPQFYGDPVPPWYMPSTKPSIINDPNDPRFNQPWKPFFNFPPGPPQGGPPIRYKPSIA